MAVSQMGGEDGYDDSGEMPRWMRRMILISMAIGASALGLWAATTVYGKLPWFPLARIALAGILLTGIICADIFKWKWLRRYAAYVAVGFVLFVVLSSPEAQSCIPKGRIN